MASTDVPNIQELLARMAPPQVPIGAIGFAPALQTKISTFDPLRTIDLLAGLMTEPKFQANGIRLDWAIRLVLAYANGHRRPKQRDLLELLNRLMEEARVTRLEDPIEDFFVESLPTQTGDSLIFSGFWEKAAAHTEAVVAAFSHLPKAPQRSDGLKKCRALLTLSSNLVGRAGLERRLVGSGEPNGSMAIPSDARLAKLARRVRYSWDELAELGISAEDLEPFFQVPGDATASLGVAAGDSPLEHRPLI